VDVIVVDIVVVVVVEDVSEIEKNEMKMIFVYQFIT
jgi:hypothetical protein